MEKWAPVFRKGHAPINEARAQRDSTESGCALGKGSVPLHAPAHVVEHRRGRPAVDLDAVGLLISAERRAREHAGLAVDLVLVEAELGERALHALDLRRAQLRVLAPWRLERTRIVDALAQVAYEQHVEIGEIVFLDH